jgi:hypothetical protein
MYFSHYYPQRLFFKYILNIYLTDILAFVLSRFDLANKALDSFFLQ